MEKLPKILLEAVASFFIGAAIMLGIMALYGVRYMIKFQTGKFALALNGMGTKVSEWHVLALDEILFICVMGGLILMLIDLIMSIIRVFNNR